jgi:hypothetical protein
MLKVNSQKDGQTGDGRWRSGKRTGTFPELKIYINSVFPIRLSNRAFGEGFDEKLFR